MGRERTKDKGDGISDLVNQGTGGLTALCCYVTAVYHHIMAIYRYLPFSASTVTTRTESVKVESLLSQKLNTPSV